uniref:Uncharacterized protein n=1 Tax=Tanacetum cinerariifolium TaxID=118510 RepID=A0A6L2NU77_TANCI|nr:hypothetical protein [Tanacetum cinerariifolium]
MTKITDIEASLEQFKSVSLAYQEETSNRFDRMQESIDKNKADAYKQFAALLQLLKALQPPTTLPATIPRFEENSGQSFSSDEVEKEVKDIGFIRALVTEDIGTCIGVLELANSQDNRNPTWAGDQSRIRETDVPSHGQRKKTHGWTGLMMTNMRGGEFKEEFGILELLTRTLPFQDKIVVHILHSGGGISFA